MLIAPRRHVGTLSALELDEMDEILLLIQQMSRRAWSAFAPSGLHTWCNSGVAAGQSEGHMHFQIVPRYQDRPYSFDSSRHIELASVVELSGIRSRLSATLAQSAPCR
jgi:diadenosine tetraphosphate (Ap4A) HIT family hydrolase